MAEVLARLGMKRTLVVWGEGNLDEMTVTGVSHVADANEGSVETYTVLPEFVGLKRATLDDIRGCDTPEKSAEQVRDVLSNKEGAKLDMVLLNAAAALMAAGSVEDLLSGMELARETIASGAALEKLENLVEFCKDA